MEVQVQGAALGAAFELLVTSVAGASMKVVGFRSQLERVKSTLCAIKPSIDDIESLNLILGRPPHETEAFTVRLMKAERLVRRCSKVSKWNFFTRLYYSHKLSKLETSLLNFFQIAGTALHLCETKRIAVAVSDMQEKLNEITKQMSRDRHTVGQATAPEGAWPVPKHPTHGCLLRRLSGAPAPN
ncbi:hypothetical protein AAHA92_27636 [Salvia divinorum]|uniref:RPW8 domain-containing protein n=1 Tax=Salvia divinorum TaxID=28513 RepID=A0ABD1G4C3_SALDI